MPGKGIESLFPKKIGKFQDKEDFQKNPVFLIEIEKVRPNPFQPRKEFSLEGLQALADSIRDHGILQPLLVVRIASQDGDQPEYELIAGERRLLAAKMAGFSQVPVIIREPQIDDKGKLVLSLIENVQRLDLNSVEKAEAYKKLQDEFNYLQKDIARLCGKSREAVANTLRLLDLSEDIRQAVREEKISEGHARALLGLEEPDRQTALLSKILRDGMSVRETENFIQKMEVWKPLKRKISPQSREIKEIEEKMKSLFGIEDLKLRIESGRPKLTVFFDSKKEIANLVEKLKK